MKVAGWEGCSMVSKAPPIRAGALFPKLIGTSEVRYRDPIGTVLFVK